MEYNKTTHEERMNILNDYAKGKPVEDIANDTGYGSPTVRAVMNRLLEITWELEGRKGPCPGIRKLRKMGMFEEMILIANRKEDKLKEVYGRKQGAYRIVDEPEDEPNFIQRFIAWVKGLFS